MVSRLQILLAECVFLEVHAHGFSQSHSISLVEFFGLVYSFVLLALEHKLHELVILVEKHIDRVFLIMIVFLNILPDPYAGLLVFAEVLYRLHILVILVLVVLPLKGGTSWLGLDWLSDLPSFLLLS